MTSCIAQMDSLPIATSSAKPSAHLSWLLTFSDLLILLLTMFVLQISMSEFRTGYLKHPTPETKMPEKPGVIDARGFEEDAYQFDRALPLGVDPTTAKPNAFVVLSEFLNDKTDLPSDHRLGQAFSSLAANLSTELRGDTLALSIAPAGYLSGEIEAPLKVFETVNAIATLLKGHQLEIHLITTSDGQEFAPPYRSTWEVCAARALLLARQITDAGVEASAVSAIGIAEERQNSDISFGGRLHPNQSVRIEIRRSKSEAALSPSESTWDWLFEQAGK